MAVAGSVGMNRHQADISLAQLLAPGVDAIGAGAEGDVVFFRRDKGGVEAPVLEVLNYCSCDFTCVFVFPEYAVRGAFAGGAMKLEMTMAGNNAIIRTYRPFS